MTIESVDDIFGAVSYEKPIAPVMDDDNTLVAHVVRTTVVWKKMFHLRVTKKDRDRFRNYMVSQGFGEIVGKNERGGVTTLFEHPIYGTGHYYVEDIGETVDSAKKRHYIGVRVSNVLC